MKPNQILICAAAAIVLACLVIFGGNFVNAQGCTPGNMVVAGSNGDSSCGPTPAAAPTIGTPTSRSITAATAYQATDPTKPSIVTVNLTSTANISLSGGTTNSATVLMGPTNGVAGGTGTIICGYSNSNTGALTIGLNLSTVAANPCTFMLPIGYYFAVRTTAGTVTIGSTFDQGIN